MLYMLERKLKAIRGYLDDTNKFENLIGKFPQKYNLAKLRKNRKSEESYQLK